MKIIHLVLAIIGCLALAREGRPAELSGGNRIAPKEQYKVGLARHQGAVPTGKVQIGIARAKPPAAGLAVKSSGPGKEASHQYHPVIPNKAKPSLAKDSPSRGSTTASIGGPPASNKNTPVLIGGAANTSKKAATLNGTAMKSRH